MALAVQEARQLNHEYIGTEHILLGLVKESSGVGANALKNLDIDLTKVRLGVEKLVKLGPDMVTHDKLQHTPRAKEVLERAIEEARNLNHNYVGTEHLLLGLLHNPEDVAAQVLMNLGLTLENVREEVVNLSGVSEPEQPEGVALSVIKLLVREWVKNLPSIRTEIGSNGSMVIERIPKGLREYLYAQLQGLLHLCTGEQCQDVEKPVTDSFCKTIDLGQITLEAIRAEMISRLGKKA